MQNYGDARNRTAVQKILAYASTRSSCVSFFNSYRYKQTKHDMNDSLIFKILSRKAEFLVPE